MQNEASNVLNEFRQGSVAAFETLFRVHQRAVYGWILRIVRNPATAEDLTVETFWRIHRAHARFQMCIRDSRPGVRKSCKSAEWRTALCAIKAQGAGLKALCHPSDEDLSLGTPAICPSQSEPLCLCRHRIGVNCSRNRGGAIPAAL